MGIDLIVEHRYTKISARRRGKSSFFSTGIDSVPCRLHFVVDSQKYAEAFFVRFVRLLAQISNLINAAKAASIPVNPIEVNGKVIEQRLNFYGFFFLEIVTFADWDIPPAAQEPVNRYEDGRFPSIASADKAD